MRKIIIAICGIILAGGAQAIVNIVDEPTQSAWNYSAENSKKYITSDYTIGTENDKYHYDYVDIVAATDIYVHGARFCLMQLQHVNASWKVFIEPSHCKTICRDGYFGDKCAYTNIGSGACEDTDLSVFFKIGTHPYQEKPIDVFDSNPRDAILLQVLSTKSHEIEVAPVEYYGNNEKRNNIGSINTRGQSYNLCAQGYKPNSFGECERMSVCDCPVGQGFEEDSKTCVVCNTSAEFYVDGQGVCRKCSDGKMFNGTECKNYDTYSIQELKKGIRNAFDCWMETGRENYKKCFECNKTWDKNAKTCQ